MMTIWDDYPSTYRSAEVQAIVSAVSAGECVQIVGLSGAGKSNLLGFIANRIQTPDLPQFALQDCNRLPRLEAGAFQELLLQALGGGLPASLPGLEKAINGRLRQSPHGLCLLVDRFDALPGEQVRLLAGNLRALRDAFKYTLSYVIGVRRQLDPNLELAELFFANTLHLGALSASDALWSARQYALRRRLDWGEAEFELLVKLSAGYPSLLRAACEAYAGGVPLDAQALTGHPAVLQRVEEIMSDHPSPDDLRKAGLRECPLFMQPQAAQVERTEFDTTALTAAENHLFVYLRQHAGQVCEKDDIIQAVWSEEVYAAGLRDESLAQLVRRLRRKIEPDPDHPVHILTVPGRGYRFI